MDVQLSIGRLDLVIVVAYLAGAYLAGIVALGLAAGIRERKPSGGEAYFLASRTLTWPAIGLALFANNISGSTRFGDQ